MRLLLITGIIVFLGGPTCAAQDADVHEVLRELHQRLDEQSRQIRALQRRLDDQENATSQESPFGVVTDRNDGSCAPRQVVRVPLTMDEPLRAGCADDESGSPFRTLDYYADYDRGFRIRPFQPKEHPFELAVNGWIQFRHHGFARDVDSWTDNAGVTRPVRNRNAFDIERARLVFSGSAVDERLTYFLQLDGDTDGADTVDFFDYWWGWQLTDTFQLQFGKRKVPGSRQWLLGARRTRFIDRPMANDFFRPDRTVGVFGVGTLGDDSHYEVMVGNGYRTANLPNAVTDDRLTFAVTHYCDPRGGFGGKLVDFDGSADPLLRIGHSFVYSPQTSDAAGMPLEETDFLRLSDGTRLTQTGALAGGVTASEYDVLLYGVDAAVKWRGWSVNAEAFCRWIENIAADAPLPRNSLEQYGYYVEGGCFLIPQSLDVNVRYSQVSGEFGTGSESAAGVNWYPLARPQLKISFDVTSLDGSPLRNTTSDILAGDDGMLFRTQLQAEF